jgi:hypothetical protein
MTGNYDVFFYFGKEKNAVARFCGMLAPQTQKKLTAMLFS